PPTARLSRPSKATSPSADSPRAASSQPPTAPAVSAPLATAIHRKPALASDLNTQRTAGLSLRSPHRTSATHTAVNRTGSASMLAPSPAGCRAASPLCARSPAGVRRWVAVQPPAGRNPPRGGSVATVRKYPELSIPAMTLGTLIGVL